jgi:alanine transaminase
MVFAFDSTLLDRAASVRKKVFDFPTHKELFFPSSYPRPDNLGMRGMCNWVIPNILMVGQYPGQSPELFAPNAKDIQSHVRAVVEDAGVNLFCSLQSEIPPQDNKSAWNFNGGERYFPDPNTRRLFPRPFKHYAPIVESYNQEVRFLHAPIDDCDVPSSGGALSDLLLDLLEAIDKEDRCVYVHCWGGRGRAGLVGACLLSLIFPEKDASEILELIQTGYDTRAGAKVMPEALQHSPQTESQREFVRMFVEERQRHAFFFISSPPISSQKANKKELA